MSTLVLASPPTAAQAAAWDCPSGDLCIWTGTNGTGSRCAWSNADNDWRSGSIVCSWSSTQPYRSVWNRGTSSSYVAVWIYGGANYTGSYDCIAQGDRFGSSNGRARSHRWQASGCW
ncbi:peptidase inhibitor family I36 protein [Micromonospora gifhornensis]|uniref:peptidase inhibitor family I36 protein n=1 Tax=Micromonospora gifhornensis TaxID=84594 RepID=UPI003D745FAF